MIGNPFPDTDADSRDFVLGAGCFFWTFDPNADTILAALPKYAVVTDIGPPTLVDIGAQGSVITVDIRITASMKE